MVKKKKLTETELTRLNEELSKAKELMTILNEQGKKYLALGNKVIDSDDRTLLYVKFPELKDLEDTLIK